MRYIPAKSIVIRKPISDEWFACDFNMNIYKGCSHGCIYCDSRSECYHVDNFEEVRAKENALQTIEKELQGKRKKGVIGTGSMSDPYNPKEAKYRLTRGALELIDRYKFGINIITKNPLITRDIDIYQNIAQHSPVCAKLTITTYDDELCQKIEPHVAPTSKRLDALRELSEAGLFTGVVVMPLLPYINDDEQNLISLVNAIAETGAKFIYLQQGVTLRQNQREYFYEQLDKLFPGVRGRYEGLFKMMYQCTSPNALRLWQVFTDLCKKHKLLYKMRDINAAYKSIGGMQSTPIQTSLF